LEEDIKNQREIVLNLPLECGIIYIKMIDQLGKKLTKDWQMLHLNFSKIDFIIFTVPNIKKKNKKTSQINSLKNGNQSKLEFDIGRIWHYLPRIRIIIIKVL